MLDVECSISPAAGMEDYMNVFITGGSGFIGRRLIDKLVTDDHRVTVLTRNAATLFPAGVRVVVGDLLKPETYRDAGTECDRLYHLAGLITFDPRRRGELFEQNAQGVGRILDAAAGWGIGRSVVVSSACTLGLSADAGRALSEDDRASDSLARANPYLSSKLAAEQEAMRRAAQQEIVVVNPTTVFGPGDRSMNSGTLIAQVARSRAVPVPPGGSNVVDVDDVIEGILAAGEKGRAGCRYVLGGENLPFRQILDTVAGVTGRHPRRIRLPAWTRIPMMAAARVAMLVVGGRFLTPQIVGDMYAFKYYSSDRASQELEWSARSTFRESVVRAWEFYRKEGLIE